MATSLTLEEADLVLAAARAKAVEIGQPMNIAVVDDGGHLVAFARMDGAIKASIDIATRKAFENAATVVAATHHAVGDLFGREVSFSQCLLTGK